MEINKVIDRINFLYHKSQNEGLTEKEREEQILLRKEYIQTITGNVRNQMERIKWADEEDKCDCHDCDCEKH